MEKFITNNTQETQKIAEDLAVKILTKKNTESAVVLGLMGNLGAGKTTFLQGFARALGVKENVLSPTFVVMKRFALSGTHFKNFYHIDCYRLNNPEEILELGFKEIISNPENIVAIEWSEKIESLLPKDNIKINFEHLEENKRELTLKK